MIDPDEHQRQINELRGRQLALIQLLPPEDALSVLAAAPVESVEEHEIVADLLQRQTLIEHIATHQEPAAED